MFVLRLTSNMAFEFAYLARLFVFLTLPFASVGFRHKECQPIPSSSLCHGLGYQTIPGSLVDAQVINQWASLVSTQCHRDAEKFICLVLLPVCMPGLEPMGPCRGLCMAVRLSCEPIFLTFGFKWPDTFDCGRFPSGTDFCVPATGPVMPVICDACILASERETTDIQNKFCKSPYAFTLQLGGVAVVEGDRRVVPLGQSRILRWGGGGAERAGGATAPSALWLSEGASCTCPALDRVEGDVRGGWYLGLARPLEGKMVLSSLVRWKGEKELNTFDESVRKQPCAASLIPPSS